MDNMNCLCRVCSGRGDFDIFLPIPIFLHENFSEHLNWKQSMNKLVEDITGMPVTKNDGLPQKICEICISYLKHAILFRQQVINNTLSLRKVLNIYAYDKEKLDKESDEEGATMIKNKESELKDNTMESLDNNKFFKNNKIPNRNNLNLVDNLSIKNTNVNKVNLGNINLPIEANFFEVEFQEDDVLEDLKDTSVIVSVNPDKIHKERKCKYCNRRYMFEKSYNSHIEECIERKLTILTFKINYFLELKNRKKISSNQFIQNMIIVLKENINFILKYSNDIIIPDLIPSNNIEYVENKLSSNLNNLIDIFERSNKTSALDFKNIEQVESTGSSVSSTPSIISTKSTIPKIRCTPCQKSFDSLQLLEKHNFKFHNEQVVTMESNNIVISNSKLIRLFEEQDGIIDISHCDKINVDKSNISSNKVQNKIIKCSMCNATFQTIAHLDLHFIKKHSCSKIN